MLIELLDTETDVSILAGVSILLGRYDDVEMYIEKLNEEDKASFLTYPICHFWDR